MLRDAWELGQISIVDTERKIERDAQSKVAVVDDSALRAYVVTRMTVTGRILFLIGIT